MINILILSQHAEEARSWLWFATRTADSRISQEKTVPDILKEVFADHPVAVLEDGRIISSRHPRSPQGAVRLC
jgi:uncharacterized protein involved in type VI secretion and phage assembly